MFQCSGGLLLERQLLHRQHEGISGWFFIEIPNSNFKCELRTSSHTKSTRSSTATRKKTRTNFKHCSWTDLARIWNEWVVVVVKRTRIRKHFKVLAPVPFEQNYQARASTLSFERITEFADDFVRRQGRFSSSIIKDIFKVSFRPFPYHFHHWICSSTWSQSPIAHSVNSPGSCSKSTTTSALTSTRMTTCKLKQRQRCQQLPMNNAAGEDAAQFQQDWRIFAQTHAGTQTTDGATSKTALKGNDDLQPQKNQQAMMRRRKKRHLSILWRGDFNQRWESWCSMFNDSLFTVHWCNLSGLWKWGPTVAALILPLVSSSDQSSL